MRSAQILIAAIYALSVVPAHARLTMNQVTGRVVESCTPHADGALRTDMNIHLSGDGLDAEETEKIDRILQRVAENSSLKPLLKDLDIEVSETSQCEYKKNSTGCVDGNKIYLSTARDARAYDELPKQLGVAFMDKRGLRSSYQSLGTCRFASTSSNVTDQFGNAFAAMLFAPRALRTECRRHYDFLVANLFGSSPYYQCETGSIIAREKALETDEWKDTGTHPLRIIFSDQNIGTFMNVGLAIWMFNMQAKAQRQAQTAYYQSLQPPPVLPIMGGPGIREAMPVPVIPNNGPPAFIPLGP